MSEIKYGILHWGPCVVKTKVDQNTLDLLLSEGEASKEDASPELAGVLKNQFHYRDKAKFQKFMEGTFNVYNHAMQRWKNEKTPSTYFLEKLWINFQGPNEFNPPHSHGGALSFVIFLKIPIELRAENQNYKGLSAGPGGITFLYGETEDRCITNHSVFPEVGDMYVFPAWVKHWVYPFSTDCTRISVSGNVIDKIELSKLKKVNGKEKA
jgi:hypothetical protein|tara:strand:+ start:683 stop:1312 length:630 start_codon:yes stop_codon:yes gene_type:complete